jgi:ammonium transporter, Amt family
MERGRLGPSMVFIFIWTTLVYDPIACWTWNPAGWLFKLGALDFAGGGPVHIASGAGALAYTIILGRRRKPNGEIDEKVPVYRPHNTAMVVTGIVFLWFGWFGFNGGSSLNMTIRSVYAANNTNLAAASGTVTWVVMDYFFMGNWSAISAASGALAGLVGTSPHPIQLILAITPACGYIPVYFAVPVGIVSAILCNLATKLKFIFNVDDALDVFAMHGIGGYAGNIMTGLFAADYVAHLDGVTVIPGGWIQHNWIQLGYQLAGATAIMAYSFTVSYLILFLMNLVPFLRLRVEEYEELTGLDETQMGEYSFEALTEKEKTWSLAAIIGGAQEDGHGGIVSR